MPIKLTANNGNIDLKVPIKQLGGGAVDSVNGMTGDVVLTANDVGAIDEYNGMTPVECVYTHFGSQQTKIIYVEEGTLIPPSSSASDDIKNAWKRLLAIPLSGLAPTGPSSSFKDLIRGIGLLADNGVFGDLLSQSGNEFICYTDIFKQDVRLCIYNSKTDDKTITVYLNFYKQNKYQQIIYCISNDTFDDYCYFEEPVKQYLSNINATVLTMPQTEMKAAPTKDMHIATKKYVDDAITNVDVDLTDYYTKTEVDVKIPSKLSQLTDDIGYAKNTDIPDVSGFLTQIPDEYVTETELDAKGYLTEHQSLSEYAKKSELFSKDYNDLTNKPTIPSVEGLASTQYVDEKVAAIVVPSLDGYATEQWVEGKGYLTQHQSLADYSTTTQVQSMIDTAIAGITDAEEVSY